MAALAGWRPYRTVAQIGDARYEEIWTVGNGSDTVLYAEEDLLGVAWVTIKGERVVELAEIVTQQLSTLTPSEVLVWVYAVEDIGEKVKALYYLAASAPNQPDDAFLAVLENELRHDRTEVRQAAIYACTYMASWPDVLPLIEAVRDGDPDETTRLYATRALNAIYRNRDSPTEVPR
jgi:hypothetical protein